MDFNKLGATAAEVDDLTVEKKFERELPVEGPAMVRYVGYVETGKHMPQNPSHSAAQKVIHMFELNHPKHLIELDGGEKIPQRMYVHQNKGRTAKSGYMKLFKVMNAACDNRYNHFVQMLGEGFLAKVYHNTAESKKVYANLHLDGAWSFAKPVQEDVVSGAQTPIPIPEAVQELIGFLWENDAVTDDDTKTMWESLFIDGVKESGGTKNWIQETVQDNMEWEGSRTQALTQEFVGLDEPEVPVLEGEVLATPEDLAKLGAGAGTDVPY